MIDLYTEGRIEMQPDTTSFNTVIDALAKSRESKVESRAERLLERMEALSSDGGLGISCKPDQVVSCFLRLNALGMV